MNRNLSVMCCLLIVSLIAVSLEPCFGQYGGTFVVELVTEPKTLDTNSVYDAFAMSVCASVYNRLLSLSEANEISPDLAEKWAVSDDSKTFTFYLSRNIKWHDGKPFTSADVKWSIEDQLKRKGISYSRLQTVREVSAPDDYTVVINLSAPNSALLYDLCHKSSFYIWPKHIFEGTDPLTNPSRDRPIGTGAFKFVEWVKGSHVALGANLEYWRGRPFLDKIIWKLAPNAASTLAQLEAGEISYIYQSTLLSEIDRIRKNPNIEVVTGKGVSILNLAFNLQRKPFDDLRVRQAISSAVNPKEISEKVYHGTLFTHLGQVLSAPQWAYNPNALCPDYNPSRADALLDEAGLKRGSDGVRFKMTTTVPIMMDFPVVAEIIKQYLKAVGIELTIEQMDWGSWTEKVLKRFDFDTVVQGGSAGPDPNELVQFYGTGGYRNCMKYSNPRVDELFVLGRSSSDQKVRAKYYFEIQDILAKDLPRYNFGDWVQAVLVRKEFTGVPQQPEAIAKGIKYCDFEQVKWLKAPATTTERPATTKTTTTPVEQSAAIPTELIAGIALLIAVVGAGVFYYRRKLRGSGKS